MTKNEMRTNLCLHNGVGVEVNGVCYFYEGNVKEAISRAYAHSNGKQMTFYSQTWARQSQFKEYMELYKKTRNKTMFPFLVKTLIEWTGCNADQAESQITNDAIHWSAFN